MLLTHGHLDHSEGAARFAELAGQRPASACRCARSTRRTGWARRGWGRATSCRAGDLVLRVVGTPGHTSDSLSFLLPAEGAVLTGDTVLGRGSTVVAYPDGRLAAYLESLDRLRDLAEVGRGDQHLAGPRAGARRRDRGDRGVPGASRRSGWSRCARPSPPARHTPRAVVEQVYADVDPALWPAAELSVRAQLDYLTERSRPLLTRPPDKPGKGG